MWFTGMFNTQIIAPVIPPSMAFIVFGVSANVLITQLFVAGIVPGSMMGTALIVTWLVVALAAGVEVNTLPPEEYARMLEKSQVVYEKHKDAIGAEVVDRAQSILADMRKK